MEHPSEDAQLNPAESQQVLVPPSGTTGTSNGRALKIAAFTTVACLLLAAQAFTAYMVFDQKHQIQELQLNKYKLEKQMDARSRVAPQKMVMPIASMPLMDLFDDAPKSEAPKQSVALPNMEEELRKMIGGQELPPLMNQTFLTNLKTLWQQMRTSDWKSFESWLHYWMIFQKAQETPTPTPELIFQKAQETPTPSPIPELVFQKAQETPTPSPIPELDYEDDMGDIAA